jgi:hypothetical protein
MRICFTGFLRTMYNWLISLLMLGGAIAVSVIALVIVRRNITLERLKRNNEVAGFIYAVVGVIYAVILAFVVVVVWEQFSDARQAVREEAGEIGDLYRHVSLLPENNRMNFQNALARYAHTIVNDEWPLMADGHESTITDSALKTIWRHVESLRPEGDYEQTVFAATIDHLDHMSVDRRLRLLSSEDTVPGVMWMLLIGGGVITVGFAFFFGTESLAAHALMIGSLAGMVAMALLLIASLDHPFAGIIQVDADPFMHLIEKMK